MSYNIYILCIPPETGGSICQQVYKKYSAASCVGNVSNRCFCSFDMDVRGKRLNENLGQFWRVI